MVWQIIAAAAALIVLAALIAHIKYVSPAYRAGRAGEAEATELIRSVLREDDRLFTGVNVAIDGKRTELDNVIVNPRGVFIIEVKTYSGTLKGSESDRVWQKTHISRGGKTYIKSARNPLPQVSRQIYILANFLGSHGVNVFVEGYALLLGAKPPCRSERLLTNASSVAGAIHKRPVRKKLTEENLKKICRLLSKL